jgi:hypothetical protein
VFDAVAHLLNPEVDLIFFDTTSTYFDFEIEQPDDPFGVTSTNASSTLTSTRTAPTAATVCAGGGGDGASGVPHLWEVEGLPRDLPQVVVGMAVTRDGIPVRVWCWPGNTSDSPLIRQVKDDLRDWTLGNVVWVADRGFTSKGNRRHLSAGGDGYILGEKLRSGSPEAAAAMARQGRYQDVTANVRVKEVNISEHERCVVCTTPMRRA